MGENKRVDNKVELLGHYGSDETIACSAWTSTSRNLTDEKKARESINKIKNSGKTHAHKMQAAIAMSQRAKVASQRAKDPEKKKNLGQAHKVYQSYIDTNKKSKDD